MSYEDLKTWVTEHRQQLLLAASFVLVFCVGFGVGRFERQLRRDRVKSQMNYTTNPKPASPKAPAEEPAPAVAAATTSAPTTTPAAKPCTVKGNISGKSKIYHVRGGSFYDRVDPEICFQSEAEALAAGFRKSSR